MLIPPHHHRKKSLVDNTISKWIKEIQTKVIKGWKGIDVNTTGRPGKTISSTQTIPSLFTFSGMVSLVNGKRRLTRADEYLRLEYERFKILLEGLTKYKELEDDRLQS